MDNAVATVKPTPLVPAGPAPHGLAARWQRARRLSAADVIGPAGQGLAAGEFAEVLAAIRAVWLASTAAPVYRVRGIA